MQQYEQLTPMSDHFSDENKKLLLQNAVAAIPRLRQVTLADETQATAHAQSNVSSSGVVKSSIDFYGYVHLLEQAAIRLDQDLGNRSVSDRRSRHVVSAHVLDLGDACIEDGEHGDSFFDDIWNTPDDPYNMSPD